MFYRVKLCLVIFILFVFSLRGEAVELVFWNFWDPKFIKQVIAKFEETHPGVTIRNEQLTWGNGLDKIVVALANGRAPDICELGSPWTGKFMAGDALIDITDQVKYLVSDYLLWEPARWNNRIFGIPWLVGTRVLFFNRLLFRNAGLDPDKPPSTWEELLAAAKRIHQPEKGIYGFCKFRGNPTTDSKVIRPLIPIESDH